MDDPGQPNVCIGCGLCCDGTVVTHLAVADASDLGQPLQAMGVEVDGRADPPVFSLPCPAFADGRCSVFHLQRPSACATFECAVSNGVADGSLTVSVAQSLIQRARELRAEVADGTLPATVLEDFLDAEFRWWSVVAR